MASKRAIRRKSCLGKVHHASEGAAWAAARKTPGTHAYKCPFCSHAEHESWCVGHPVGMRRQAIAARREAA